MVKVGINGFGRIGRNFLRAALGNPDLQIVAINDLTDSKTLAHLLKHDSLLGTLPAPVEAADGALQVDGQRITVFSERDPANIREETGRFNHHVNARIAPGNIRRIAFAKDGNALAVNLQRALQVDGQRITVFSERDPANIPWRDAGVDVVIEATGFFTNIRRIAFAKDGNALAVNLQRAVRCFNGCR